MRALKRSIARHLMELHGVKNINRRKYQTAPSKKASFFALHWREYLDPESAYRKSLESDMKRQAALLSRQYQKPIRPGWPVPRRG